MADEAVAKAIARSKSPYKKLTPQQRIEAQKRYAAGERSGLIAADFGVTSGAITYLAKRSGIDTKRTSRRIPLRQEAFDVLTAEAKYWLGLLTADGHANRRVVSLGLRLPDIAHLQRFKAFLGYGGSFRIIDPSIVTKNATGFASITFDSPYMVRRLQALGVTHPKSTRSVNAELQESRDFWRGVVDGDGTVGSYKLGNPRKEYPHLSLCGSREIIESFLIFCAGIVEIKSRALKASSGNIFVTAIRGKRALSIMRVLYQDGDLSLTRKHATVQKTLALNFYK